jgi:nucleoside-diphosphate-sugar epimerase
MARILIAGCGWLGEALGVALARRGDLVWGLRRRAAGLAPELRPIAADLDDARSLTDLPTTLDAVVFAAAPESSDEDSYRRTYGRGLANLLRTLSESGARRPGDSARPRVVLLSSTSVYGQTAGEWVDESSPTEPTDFRGRLVLAGEETLLTSGFPCAVLRLGGLYGPGRESLIDAVRDGRATLSPGPARFTNRIHRDDAVGAIVHLLALSPSDAAPVYAGVDEEPADRNDVLRFLAGQLGVPLCEGTTPGRQREPLARTETNKRCSSARLRESGYRFRYPSYRDGYSAILDARSSARSSAPSRA